MADYLFQITQRHWMLILSFGLVGFIATGLWVFISFDRISIAKVDLAVGFYSRTSIHPQKIDLLTPLENIPDLVERIKVQYDYYSDSQRRPRLQSIRKEGITDFALKMVAVGDNDEQARDFLNKIVETILRDHTSVLEQILVKKSVHTDLVLFSRPTQTWAPIIVGPRDMRRPIFLLGALGGLLSLLFGLVVAAILNLRLPIRESRKK